MGAGVEGMSDTTVVTRDVGTCGVVFPSCESLLKHRQPFLFVSQGVIDKEDGSARCDYRFDEDAWFFEGHFPQAPIVPGVLVLEMAAQTANTVLSARCERPVKAYLVSVQNAVFKAPVGAGDAIVAHARLMDGSQAQRKLAPGDFLRFKVSVRRDEQVCMRGEVTLCLAD